MQNEYGSTPLMIACTAGQVTTAALLIEKGANVNYINKVKQIQCGYIVTVVVVCTKIIHKLMSYSKSAIGEIGIIQYYHLDIMYMYVT